MKIKTSWIVLGIIGILVIWMIVAYNGMVSSEANVENKFGNIQVEYQRRADLVPQLVATVDEAAKNESGILTRVTEARAGITKATTPAEIEKAGREINSAINLAFEAYPQIRATENFSQLQDQLEGTENRIEKARIDYNNAVKDFNSRIKRFPANVFNAMYGFEPKESFSATEGSDKPVDVRKEFDKE